MDMNYDFVAEAKKAGIYDTFSQEDLDLASRHSDFGKTAITQKLIWLDPNSTPEQKAAANKTLNDARMSYGNYSGGADGKTITYGPKTAGQLSTATDQLVSFSNNDYTYNPYDSKYKSDADKAYHEIINRPDFYYNKEEDPQWGSYKKSYLREGDRATANTLAQTSAASGGRASSYAVNAASQAGDYYATKLNDVIPTLYQQAYNRYLKEFEMDTKTLDMINAQDQIDYNRHLDTRNFDYDIHKDKFGMLKDVQSALSTEQKRQDDKAYNELLAALDTTKTMGSVSDQNSGILGYAPGTQTAQQSQFDKEVETRILEILGQAIPGVAESLGIPVGTQTLDREKYNTDIEQFDTEQHRLILEALGEVIPEIAEKLNLPVGTKTVDKMYKDMLLDLEKDKNALGWEEHYADVDYKQRLTDHDAEELAYRQELDKIATAATASNTSNAAEQKVIQQAIAGEYLEKFLNGDTSAATMNELYAAGYTPTDLEKTLEMYNKGILSAFLAGDHSDETVKKMREMGYTEAQLKENGYNGDYFTRQNAAAGGGSFTDYNKAIEYLMVKGISDSEISKIMTRDEWSRRRTQYQKTGDGGAEVANYSSYPEYLTEYVLYLEKGN